MDGEEYEVIPAHVNAASKALQLMYDKLGRPQDPLSASGEKLMKVIIAVWMDLYPEESTRWLAQRTEYKQAELSISEQSRKHTGRSLASYPFHIYKMMKLLFPDFKMNERSNVIKLVEKYPIFQFANKV